MITARTGNAFGVERLKEFVPAQTTEVLGVISDRVEMPDRAAVLRQTRRLEAGDFFQMRAQVVRVLAAARGFLDQLVKLLQEHHSLELLHAVVAAPGEKWLGPLKVARGSPDVVESMAPVQQIIAVA